MYFMSPGLQHINQYLSSTTVSWYLSVYFCIALHFTGVVMQVQLRLISCSIQTLTDFPTSEKSCVLSHSPLEIPPCLF